MQGTPPTPKLDRELMEQLMFGTGRVRRFTQDSPILPDVWLEYAKPRDERTDRLAAEIDPGSKDPFPPVKLLLTPFRDTHTGDIQRELRKRLDDERKKPEWKAFKHSPRAPKQVVYNQSTVAARLYFEDLIRAVLPMTDWWHRLDELWRLEDVDTTAGQERLAEAVMDPEHPPLLPTGKEGEERRPPPDLLWMIRVVGALALIRKGDSLPGIFYDYKKDGVAKAEPKDWLCLVQAIAGLIRGITPGKEDVKIYSVSLNREAARTVFDSTLAIKSDAARRLFDISCRDLAWAVIDSGIDARHPAFRKRKEKDPDAIYGKPFLNDEDEEENCTRIEETYDFTQIEDILDPDMARPPQHLKARMDADKDLAKTFRRLKRSLADGGTVDWNLLAPLIRIPHDQTYKAPTPRNDHGTHVAGILAGNWRSKDSKGALKKDLTGVCPDLRLYDLRVLNDDGVGDEFAVMNAMQFIRYLNSTNDFMAVHGVNLSLSIRHDVSNYACGRTPVCEECERVVSSGVVVVAAAGNQGYRKDRTFDGMTVEVYNSISITDPGNADLVITVGATHRSRPHTYGVSFFSSRGPTGDGRIKPDLVAPGEKITAPLPGDTFGLKDGTSMAAPHVSGAAALLMARHKELVGRPTRIKQILCSTATDLGRERYFQGAGMLDTLRALQSV
jgi:serine protease AprX